MSSSDGHNDGSGKHARAGLRRCARCRASAAPHAAGRAPTHRHGIVHGGLGPENVLLEPRAGRRDFVKLRGFGVARLEAERPGAEPQPGVLDHRADVHALGALAYHIVTGQPPLAANEADAPTEAPRAPSALRPPGTLPVHLDAVILPAL